MTDFEKNVINKRVNRAVGLDTFDMPLAIYVVQGSEFPRQIDGLVIPDHAVYAHWNSFHQSLMGQLPSTSFDGVNNDKPFFLA
ncbi:MAG: hypothetical protein Q7R59_01450 [bacterium]|nr:hypothetical protein [bacterium]